MESVPQFQIPLYCSVDEIIWRTSLEKTGIRWIIYCHLLLTVDIKRKEMEKNSGHPEQSIGINLFYDTPLHYNNNISNTNTIVHSQQKCNNKEGVYK